MSATLGGGLGERVRQLMAAAAAGLDLKEEEAAASAASSTGARSGSRASEDGGVSCAVPLVASEGRCYPVRTTYLGRPEGGGRGAERRGRGGGGTRL